MKLTKIQTAILATLATRGQYVTSCGTVKRPLGHKTYSFGRRESAAVRALERMGYVTVTRQEHQLLDGTWEIAMVVKPRASAESGSR